MPNGLCLVASALMTFTLILSAFIGLETFRHLLLKLLRHMLLTYTHSFSVKQISFQLTVKTSTPVLGNAIPVLSG